MKAAPERRSLVVLGCGNPSRGDDSLGPALMKRVEDWIRVHPGRPVTAVEDFQFQVEHTLDLRGCDIALFVDASAAGPDGVTLSRIAPGASSSFSTHALAPESLLQAFGALDCGDPPRAFTLSVRGHDFRLGRGLSPRGRKNLELGWSLLERLLEDPSEIFWGGLCVAASDGATPRRKGRGGREEV